MFKTYFDEVENMAVIGRCFTFACANNRDIVRRLIATCEAFHGMTFADAMQTFRSYERNGLVKRNNEYIVVYHAA